MRYNPEQQPILPHTELTDSFTNFLRSKNRNEWLKELKVFYKQKLADLVNENKGVTYLCIKPCVQLVQNLHLLNFNKDQLTDIVTLYILMGWELGKEGLPGKIDTIINIAQAIKHTENDNSDQQKLIRTLLQTGSIIAENNNRRLEPFAKHMININF